MFLQENLLPLFQINLRFLQIFGSTNLTLYNNDFKNKILRKRNKFSTVNAYFKLLLFTTFVLILCVQAWLGLDKFPRIVIFEATLYITVYAMGIVINLVYLGRADKITEIFNLFLQFDRRRMGNF